MQTKLKILNKSQTERLVFKIKSNIKGNYECQPTMGVLDVNTAQNIQITFIGPSDTNFRDHKFMIVLKNSQKVMYSNEVAEFWKINNDGE